MMKTTTRPLHAWAIINREYIMSAIFPTRRMAVKYMSDGSAKEWAHLRKHGFRVERVVVRLAPSQKNAR